MASPDESVAGINSVRLFSRVGATNSPIGFTPIEFTAADVLELRDTTPTRFPAVWLPIWVPTISHV